MRRILAFILTLVVVLSVAAAALPSNESLSYKVMYKWGLINKQAGSASLSIRTAGSQYKLALTARSASWADKFYCLRDTLTGIVNRSGYKPVRYENRSHEGGDYKHAIVTYQHNGNNVTAKAVNTTKKKKEKSPTTRNQTFTATGTAMDMLSVFYYMRTIEYGQMNVGGTKVVTIFSGKQKETLTIRYNGVQNVKIDGKQRNCYHIKFSFTSKGGKKTSDDMDAWISTDSRRIPLKMEGKLPVGKVQCYYTGG